ncbi:unnamed protein product [Ectocarpus sp. 12 AP-2014]
MARAEVRVGNSGAEESHQPSTQATGSPTGLFCPQVDRTLYLMPNCPVIFHGPIRLCAIFRKNCATAVVVLPTVFPPRPRVGRKSSDSLSLQIQMGVLLMQFPGLHCTQRCSSKHYIVRGKSKRSILIWLHHREEHGHVS